MRKVLMIMFMTLDGRAQFPVSRGPSDASDPDPMWRPRYASVDTILLGAGAYRAWARFWPKRREDPEANDWEREFADFANRAQKVVFSKSLQPPLWENTRIARGTIRDELSALRSKTGGDIVLGGGPRIAQSFLAEELVDEMLIAVFPSIVERGKPFFHTVDEPDFAEDVIPLGAPGRHDFRLLELQPMPDGTVFLHYERAR